MSDPLLLNTRQVASFAARGFLRLDGVVGEDINQAFLAEIGQFDEPVESIRKHYAGLMARSSIPVVPAGTPLANAYPTSSALHDMINVPAVRGAIASLVGEDCRFDHHFLHMTVPGHPAQHTHQDSTIDPRRAFDIQIMYFPHDVTAAMGGTRFVPGTHLRVVSEAAVSRYQNILGQQHAVCSAGTVLVMHHGIWHGGGLNRSETIRSMFKIRLCPQAPQVRLWDTSDLPDSNDQRAIFWTAPPDPADIASILTTPEPWFENDTGRLEYLNRIRLWRYLTGDDEYDADYWLTRVENEYA
jgi:hypothetical protein